MAPLRTDAPGTPGGGGARRLGSRLLLLFTTLATLLILAELAARAFVAWQEAGRYARRRANQTELQNIFDVAKKNVDGVYQGVPFRTNSQGIRGPDYPPETGPEVFRILITGDSVTMGWAVEEELAYPGRLGALLQEARADGRRYEVLNLGLAGVNAGFAAERLRNLSAHYRPDLVIYGATLNDIEGRHYEKLPEPDSHSSRRAVFRRALRFDDSPSALLRLLWPRLIAVLEPDAFVPSEDTRPRLHDELQHNYFENPAAWRAYEGALDDLAGTARARGICAHVFVHTHLNDLTAEHPYAPIYDRIAEAARARGMTASGSLDGFLGLAPAELWTHVFDVHPNARGHEILAASLARGLAALPADCWQKAEAYRPDGPEASPSAASSAGSSTSSSPSSSSR